MAWQDDMTEVLRVLVNDTEDTPTYSDDKLERVLVVASFQVLLQLKFSQDYKVNISNRTITPDPTATATKDESFVNLATLKAACIVDHGAAIIAAQRAIAVKDGGSSVDLRGVFQGKFALLEKGWCAVFDTEKFEYQAGLVRVAGAVILTPFRLYAYGGLGQDGYLGGSRNRDLIY